MSSPQTPRFTWESGIWGPIPRWLSPPDVSAIKSVARKHLRLSAGDHISATFFAEGGFNKLFTITVSNSGSTLGTPQYVFRATAPVEPFFKTAGEVATLSYLQEHTSIPVPRIIAHSSTSDNELMERVFISHPGFWSNLIISITEKNAKYAFQILNFNVSLEAMSRSAHSNLATAQSKESYRSVAACSGLLMG